MVGEENVPETGTAPDKRLDFLEAVSDEVSAPAKLSTERPVVEPELDKWYYAGPVRVTEKVNRQEYDSSDSVNRIHLDGHVVFGMKVLLDALECAMRWASVTTILDEGEAVSLSAVNIELKSKLLEGQQANVFVRIVDHKRGKATTLDVQVRLAEGSRTLCSCARVIGKPIPAALQK